ncbi:MAG: efflux RND transporter periplasmic adaptor subunit [Bacteroidales bacterium]|jgi:RND family efflux transporter MFP subunit|nr:efflux RND transporter periplasmic adaptor subunit [Bacteroidales bacterium]
MKKILIIISAIFFLFSACKQKNTQVDTIPMVKLCTVEKYGEESTVSFPGKVKAASEINLSFRISGPIDKINVTEGQFILKGQVLAEMDSRDYAIQFSATEAEYNQVKAEAERVIQLYEKQSISANDYDKAVSGLQQITAKYNAHKNALSDTKLIAPFDGYVQKRYYDKGETVGAGMPVFSIISTGMPEVEINIPAGEFIRRDRFDSYTCYFDIFPDQTFPLELVSINQKANLNQMYSVRFKMTGNINPQTPTPGMSTMVNIHFKPEENNIVSVPINAMFEIDGQPTVWIYDESKQIINIRNIKLAEILTDGTLVVSEGLKAGEKVVAVGVHNLPDGGKVKILSEPSKTNVGGLL